jgi:hypothetical protein
MKKLFSFICLLALLIEFSSCATLVGGQVTTYQRTKPVPGRPSREVKVVPLVCDIIFLGGVGIIVDFATGAIYKPLPSKKGLFEQ